MFERTLLKLSLSRMHFPVCSLGPGKRVGLWFQGCSIKCPGCISMDTWTSSINQVDLSQVLDLLEDWLPNADGITITGGEPFDQVVPLKQILEISRSFSHINTFVFTGYESNSISNQLQYLDGLIDTIMTGPFDESAPQSKPLRGSDNQKLLALTHFGKALKQEIEKMSADTRPLDFVFDGDSAWMAGVPARKDIQRVIQLIGSKGIDAKSLEHRSVNKRSHD